MQKPEDDFATKFKLKEGEWECNGCYCQNDASMTVCPACQTPKPGSTPAAKPPTQIGAGFQPSTNMPGAFSSQSNTDLAAKFKPKEGDWTCDGCYCENDGTVLVCPACQTPKPGSAPAPSAQPTAPAAGTQSTFGFKPSAPAVGTQSAFGFKPTAPAVETQSVFGFKPAVSSASASSSAFSFGSPSGASAQPKVKSSPNVGFSFGFSFGGGGQATTPVKQTVSNQESGVPATTPGGTPTTRFSLNARDSRSSGLPQFSFGQDSKDPEPTSSSFVFGTMSSIQSSPERERGDQTTKQRTPASQFPFTQVLQSLTTNTSTPKSSFSSAITNCQVPAFSFLGKCRFD